MMWAWLERSSSKAMERDSVWHKVCVSRQWNFKTKTATNIEKDRCVVVAWQENAEKESSGKELYSTGAWLKLRSNGKTLAGDELPRKRKRKSDGKSRCTAHNTNWWTAFIWRRTTRSGGLLPLWGRVGVSDCWSEMGREEPKDRASCYVRLVPEVEWRPVVSEV